MENKLVASVALTALVAFFAGFYSAPRPGATYMDHSMHGGMGEAMDSMTMDLVGKEGDEFDKAFLEGMVVHHEGAVEMANMVLATSKRAELRTLAEDIISAQTREIGMMRGWKEAWFR